MALECPPEQGWPCLQALGVQDQGHSIVPFNAGIGATALFHPMQCVHVRFSSPVTMLVYGLQYAVHDARHTMHDA